MPKVHNARRQRAKELLERATRGPATDLTFCQLDCHFSLPDEQRKVITEHFRNRYKLWAETWVVPELHYLIPELKDES